MKGVIFLRSNPVMPDPRVEKEVNSLIKYGYDVQILAWDRTSTLKDGWKELYNSKVKINFVKEKSNYGLGFKKNFIPLLKFQMKLITKLYKKRKEYEIIHACDFDTVIPAFIISKIFKKKYVYDIFDYYVDAYSVPIKFKGTIEKIDRFMILNSESTIICSEKRLEQIKGAKPKKIEIIHNSPLKYDCKIKSNYVGGIMKICYIGILGEERMIQEILEIVASDKNYELHIGGFGVLEDVVRNFANQNHNIIYYGKISYEKTMEIEAGCHILTALYEPKNRNHYYAAPNKFYEGMMLGKPLIMAKNTGMTEVVINLKCGELIDFSKEGLRIGLEDLAMRKNEFSQMKNRMQKEYKEKYSWEMMEKRLLKIYKEI
ncbi:MAG: hypothetical protein ACRC6T_06640 [Sarcina sp.]